MKKTAALILCTILISGYSAQSVFADNISISGNGTAAVESSSSSKETDDAAYRYTQYQGEISLYANTKDLFLGISAGFLLSQRIGAYMTVFGYGRPFSKSYYEQKGPKTYYQYQENRFLIGLGLEEQLMVYEPFGIYFGAGGAYSFSMYGGSDNMGKSYASPLFRGGVLLDFEHLLIKCGYQYMQIPQSPDHYLGFSFAAAY